jgi:hypothetical protein
MSEIKNMLKGNENENINGVNKTSLSKNIIRGVVLSTLLTLT